MAHHSWIVVLSKKLLSGLLGGLVSGNIGCAQEVEEVNVQRSVAKRSDASSVLDVDEANEFWPSWRGPFGTGVSPNGHPPTTWSETSNVRWKVELQGKGLSTPIVWKEHVFITTAVSIGDELKPLKRPSPGAHDNDSALHKLRYLVLAYNRKDGTLAWKKNVLESQPSESTHTTGSWASPSIVTDGQHLLVSFGSQGIFCLEMEGDLVWKKDLGEMSIKHGHGEGSSLALSGDRVIANWDHEGESFVVALDKLTGDEAWRVARDESTSWSTPLIVEIEGRRQVVVSATNRVRAYDLNDGEVVWECGGLSGNVVVTPIYEDGLLFVANSYDGQALFAIRIKEAQGDVTGSGLVVWGIRRHTPYVSTPLLFGNQLWFVSHLQNILVCLEAKTGNLVFDLQRIAGLRDVFASPVGAGGHVYVTSRNGVTAVFKQGDQFEMVASNLLDDVFAASPAVVDGELYLRGDQFLYCIAEDGDQQSIDQRE